MNRILSIVGARPQFIKAAAVSRALRARDEMEEVLVHTGQHYDANMSAIFFDELGIPEPDYNLGVGSGSHGVQTARMIEEIERVVEAERPAAVLIYGDTNSTLAGAVVSAKMNIPIAHVEAGLRSFNREMPEEINRVLADHASDILFAPTDVAMENLRREGLSDRAHRVGDVMYDAALFYADSLDTAARCRVLLEDDISDGFILATVHRAENTDDEDRLRRIFGALQRTSKEMPVVIPLHPRTEKALIEADLLGEMKETISVIPPVGYLDMISLERQAQLIVTDSGGVQKEAYFQETPCVTLRDETEWTELVEAGCNTLVPPTAEMRMVAEIQNQIDSEFDADRYIYGDGSASETIVDILQAS
jgi:UDP-GlcNAc3NAcA epimerase